MPAKQPRAPQPYRRYTHAQREAAVAMRRAGLNLTQIAARIGCTRQAVAAWCGLEGVPVPSRGHRRGNVPQASIDAMRRLHLHKQALPYVSTPGSTPPSE